MQAKESGHFAQFVEDEPFDEYIQRKRHDGVHGNNPEIQAISELFNRPVEVFVPEKGGTMLSLCSCCWFSSLFMFLTPFCTTATPINIFQSEYKTLDVPIRLSYHDGNHYNAVVDPLLPTAGLGLGLPGLKPGLADRMQLSKAKVESDRLADQMELERVLEESHNDVLQRAIKESTHTADRVSLSCCCLYVARAPLCLFFFLWLLVVVQFLSFFTHSFSCSCFLLLLR